MTILVRWPRTVFWATILAHVVLMSMAVGIGIQASSYTNETLAMAFSVAIGVYGVLVTFKLVYDLIQVVRQRRQVTEAQMRYETRRLLTPQFQVDRLGSQPHVRLYDVFGIPLCGPGSNLTRRQRKKIKERMLKNW